MRRKIKQKKVRNETLPLPLLRKHKKTKQAELYTVTESQNENYILQNRDKRGIKLEGKRSRPIYQLKSHGTSFCFVYFCGANVISTMLLFRSVNYNDQLTDTFCARFIWQQKQTLLAEIRSHAFRKFGFEPGLSPITRSIKSHHKHSLLLGLHFSELYPSI